MDLIGLPSIIANRALKWHPLAIHHVRLNLPAMQPKLEAFSASSNSKVTEETVEKDAHVSETAVQLDTANEKPPPENGWIISGWDIAKINYRE